MGATAVAPPPGFELDPVASLPPGFEIDGAAPTKPAPPPPPPVRQVGPLESALRTVGEAARKAVGMFDMAAGGLASLVGGQGEAERVFAMRDARQRSMSDAYAPKPGEDFSTAGQLAGGVLSAPIEVAGGLGLQHGVERAADVTEHGGTLGQAATAGAVSGGVHAALNALPIKVGGAVGRAVESKLGGALGGAATGVAVNVPAGVAGRAAENAALPEGSEFQDLRQNVAPTAVDVGMAAGLGALPGAAAAGSARLKAANEKQAALDRPELEGIRAAHDAGFKLTPEAARAGTLAKTAGKVAGNAALAKENVAHNAENASRLIREWVGLADDTPLTTEASRKLRKDAGDDYAVLKGLGRFENDAQYTDQIDKIIAPIKEAAEDFPGFSKSPLVAQLEALKQGEVSTASAVEVVKQLRENADEAFRAGRTKSGLAYREAAEAVDGSMDRAMGRLAESSGDPSVAEAVGKYRAARVQIAKTYLLDEAMRGSLTPGEVNMGTFVKALDNKVPLDGGALAVAKFAKQFGGTGLTAKKAKGQSKGLSPSDIVVSALMHIPAGSIGVVLGLGRPFTRKALASDLAQRLMAGSKPMAMPDLPPLDSAAASIARENPGLAQGFEDVPQGGAPAPESPLGDLTPDWETVPGAAPAARAEAVPAEGLVPAVDEAQPLRVQPAGAAQEAAGASLRGAGDQIPAVPGRPDLPDAMVAGPPAELAASDATGTAMQTPEAALARRQQLAEVERVRAKAAESPEVAKVLDEHTKALERQAAADEAKAKKAKAAVELRKAAGYTTDPVLKERLLKRALALEGDEKVPTGKATEGAPKDKPEPPAKPLPAGEATELPVETVVAEDPTIPVGEATEIPVEDPTPLKTAWKVGEVYVDGKGRKAMYQKDGTWKILPDKK